VNEPTAWLVGDGRVLASATLAMSSRDRRVGLRGAHEFDGAFVLADCRWIHTIGMRFDVDVAYLDSQGRVIKAVRMKRHRLGAPVLGARTVVEAERGAFARWGLRVGDVVEVRANTEGRT
jgi:uncharacterized membrane protein (UPF0127 family)